MTYGMLVSFVVLPSTYLVFLICNIDAQWLKPRSPHNNLHDNFYPEMGNFLIKATLVLLTSLVSLGIVSALT